MTFNTRSTPRLGQTSPALTSLGAVGGARGVSAGALRIFVEFLTSYDRGAIKQLESDLANVDHASNNSSIAEDKRLHRLAQVRSSLAEADRVTRSKLNTELRSDLKKIEALESSRSKTNRTLGAQERTRFTTLAKSLGLSKEETDLLANRGRLLKEQDVLEARQEKAQAGQVQRARQRAQVEGQISKIQQVRANLGPKLAGLAIGAVGGIVGGAILGVGFQLAQTALEKLGDVVQDLFDPARHAREAMVDLAKAVNDVADAKKISQLQAASEIVAKFGISGSRADQLSETLSQVAVTQGIIDALKTQAQATDVLNHQDKLRAELLKLVTEQVRNDARATGEYRSEQEQVNRGAKVSSTVTHEWVGSMTLAEAALQRLNTLLGIHSNEAAKAAFADQQLAAAQQLAAFAADKFANALKGLIESRRASADASIAGLSDEPSARTKSLEAQLEAAQGGSGAGATLRNLAEERQLILLRQRLRLLGANIDLEKFSGKFLLEAINSKIKALEKEGDEQDRLNNLLDHQFEATKQIKRQTGESVADFIERRAQEQRHQLAQQQKDQRDALIASLQNQQEKVQDEVALVENAEAAKTAAAQAGQSARVKQLQKALEESRKADRKALQDQKDAIEDKFKAEQKAAEDAIRLASTTEAEKFRIALTAVKKIEDVISLSAEVQGRKAALGFLNAFGPTLVASGALTQQELDRQKSVITASLAGFANKRNQIITGRPIGRGPLEFAQGGVMLLNNSRSPFGQNVKTGEGGTELGVILSNKVTQALRDQRGVAGQIGPFYMQSSGNELTDRYRMKKTISDAVQEALRG